MVDGIRRPPSPLHAGAPASFPPLARYGVRWLCHGFQQQASNSNPNKGRCVKCRWYYTWGERFCSSCGGSVHYWQDGKSGAGKGKGCSRQDFRQWPSLPTRAQTGPAKGETTREQSSSNKTTQPPEPSTPRGQDKQAGPTPDPDDLEKFYRFGLSVLGEEHQATKDAKDRWISAVKAKQELEQRRKASSTLEKQVHIAKEKLGRLQKRIAKAENTVIEHKEMVDKAVLQHQRSIEAVQTVKTSKRRPRRIMTPLSPSSRRKEGPPRSPPTCYGS